MSRRNQDSSLKDATRQTLSPNEVFQRFQPAQVAAALSAAHEAGITHRDIKPENVMVRRDGIVKVLDFGLAKLAEPSSFAAETQAPTVAGGRTESGVVMGTPRYMSPEQARGEKVDARTDIFSLGVMLYEMIAGRAPFAGTTPIEVIASILRDSPPPLAECAPDAPLEMERILSKALRKDRDERYQTVKELLGDLKDLTEEQAFEARLERSVLPESASRAEAREAPPASDDDLVPEKAESYADPTPLALNSPPKRTSRWARPVVLLSAVVIVGIAVWVVWWIAFSRAPELQPPQITPFTSFTGNEMQPSFSPDGNQIAFVWDGEQGGNQDIYVKAA